MRLALTTIFGVAAGAISGRLLPAFRQMQTRCSPGAEGLQGSSAKPIGLALMMSVAKLIGATLMIPVLYL